jgi:hypothetical protein
MSRVWSRRFTARDSISYYAWWENLRQVRRAARAQPAITGMTGTPLEINRYEAKKTAAAK